MPNRIIREGILTSDRVNELGAKEEVFYRRLLSVVDDFGRFTADPRILKASLYPLKLDQIRQADIPRWVAACETAGLIALYAVKGKEYLEVKEFNQRTRALKSKFPPPDGHMTVIRQSYAHGDGDGDGDVSTLCAGGAGAKANAEKAFNLEAFKGQARQEIEGFKAEGSQERDLEESLLNRCCELFGDSDMSTYGGNWRNRARRNPGKLERVLDETADAIACGRVRETPAAYANDMWGRFK